MSPQQAKAELQRQATRLGYTGGAGIQRLLNTLDAVIDGTGTYPWAGANDSIVRYIHELQQRANGNAFRGANTQAQTNGKLP